MTILLHLFSPGHEKLILKQLVLTKLLNQTSTAGTTCISNKKVFVYVCWGKPLMFQTPK